MLNIDGREKFKVFQDMAKRRFRVVSRLEHQPHEAMATQVDGQCEEYKSYLVGPGDMDAGNPQRRRYGDG